MKYITRSIFIISMLLISFTIYRNCTLGTKYEISNPVDNMNAVVTNKVIAYETEYIYNESKPSNSDPVVIQEGENGLGVSFDGNSFITLNEAKNEIVEVGTGKDGEYTGRLTGYGADCYGCSSVGNVSCLTKEGTRHSLTSDGMYYNDYMYGEVRIIAADNGAFPCGTVINIENDNIGKITAVVLDTGYSMRNAWANGKMWIDLAFVTQTDAKNGMETNDNTKFSVQRWGW